MGLMLEDLAERFSVSISFLSTTFTTWIMLMERELELLCPCPSREVIGQRLPAQFADFVNIRMIIDCTEVFIQRASCFVAQNRTFSNYKHHSTMKFLVAITPTGALTFVSSAWVVEPQTDTLQSTVVFSTYCRKETWCWLTKVSISVISWLQGRFI